MTRRKATLEKWLLHSQVERQHHSLHNETAFQGYKVSDIPKTTWSRVSHSAASADIQDHTHTHKRIHPVMHLSPWEIKAINTVVCI